MNAPQSQDRLEDTLQRLMLQAVAEGVAHAEADLGLNTAGAADAAAAVQHPQAWPHPLLSQALLNRIETLADGSGMDLSTEDGMDDMLNSLIQLALRRRARHLAAGGAA